MTRVIRYTTDDVGKEFEAEITDVIEDDVGFKIRFNDGGLRESKMSCSDYDPKTRTYKPNAKKRQAQCSKFNEKFGIPVSSKERLSGHKIKVTVKAYRGNAYASVELI